MRLWGNWGPQRPKQKKNASGWQAKIKAAKTLNHEPACVAGGTQSSPEAMSAGDLKENKKPLLEATRRPEAVVWLPIAKATKSGLLFSGGFAAYHNIFCLTSLHNDVM